MPHQLTFASSNKSKFDEIKFILSQLGIVVSFVEASLVEIQSDRLETIAIEKAKSAFAKITKPVIVEDDGLFIDCLNGFPGQYSSFVLHAIGNNGILRLMAGSRNRAASFKSAIAFFDGCLQMFFVGTTVGRISTRITKGGWGYDPIFIPLGTTLTFGELRVTKNQYSHRKKALEKFVRWYRKQ